MAEHFERPLYPIPTAQLATQPEFVEGELIHTFKIAKHFNALLLLDKADVFLERRGPFNSSKDAIVTIFLRNLEYFQGIFFLTTNREAEFDTAILSRIHVKIKYSGLNQQQRKKIWKGFISQSLTHQGPAEIDDCDLEHLAAKNMNGREIKNLVSIAHAIATAKNARVNRKYIEMASTFNEDYSCELDRVKSHSIYA